MSGLKIGLTGGIGSGKSTVAAMFEQQGALLFDADAVSRELTSVGGDAMPALIQAFGPEIATPEGALDRPRMRGLAFGDAAQRQKLESILHPMIARRREIAVEQAGGRPLVFDIPLLAESPHWRARVDRILVVDCSEDTQITRVGARSGLSPDEVRRIIGSQTSRERRRAVADAVICNDDLSVEELSRAVRAVWHHWCGPG